MPEPRPNEGHDEFIERCMADGEANEDFPDPAQRRAFCESQWERREERAMKKTKIEIPASVPGSAQRGPFFAKASGRLFDVKAQDEGVTQIDLYEEIGFFGVTAAAFRRVLHSARDIRLRINSPGGDVFDAIAIHNDLVDHEGRVDVEISGLAASGASIIAMAGDTITIAESAHVMIHNAFGGVLGDRHDMAQFAEVLEGIDKGMARIYADRTKVGIRAVTQMMDDETWLTGPEAVEKGFADQLSGKDAEARARFDLSCYKHAPAALLASFAAEPRPEFTMRDVEQALRHMGCSRSRAEALAARAFGRAAQGEPGREPSPDQGEPELEELVAAFKQADWL